MLHLALAEGGPALQRELKEALLAAYFVRAEDVGDHDVLRAAARAAGLDAARVDAVLASDEYADAVQADIAQARAYGATGVPFYVVDQQVRRLRRPARRGVRPGAGAGLGRVAPPAADGRRGRRLRARRLRGLTDAPGRRPGDAGPVPGPVRCV